MLQAVFLRRLAGTPLLLLVLAAPLQAQTADPSAEEAAKLFAQAQPYLEEVLGGKLQRAPQFRGTTVEQLRCRPDPELLAYLRWQFPSLEGDTLKNTLLVTRYLAVGATVVERAEGSEVIEVLPEQQRRSIAGWDADLKAVADPAFLQLALIHETVRWLLDRQYDLPARRRATKDGEEYHALQALVEGRAQWVTLQVAKRLGTTSYVPLLAQRFLRVPDVGTDGALRAASQKTLRQRHWAYVQGLDFFTYLEQNGVKDCERAVFGGLPRQLSVVNRPDLYVRSLHNPAGDLTAALAKLQTAFPESEWQALLQPWTADMVRQVAGLLGDRARVDKVVGGWEEGRTLVWMRKSNPAQHVALNVVRHQSRAAAGLYFEYVVALQRRQVGGSACGSSFKVLEATSKTVSIPHADEAIYAEKKVELAPGVPPLTVRTWLVRAGDVVLECSWNGVPADADWTGRIIGAVLAEVVR